MPGSKYYDYEDKLCKHGKDHNGMYCTLCKKERNLRNEAREEARARGVNLFLKEELTKRGLDYY